MRATLSVATTVLLLTAAGCGSKVTSEQFGKINFSMTRAEVEAVLGPGKLQGDFPPNVYRWEADNNGWVEIAFNGKEGKVMSMRSEGVSRGSGVPKAPNPTVPAKPGAEASAKTGMEPKGPLPKAPVKDIYSTGLPGLRATLVTVMAGSGKLPESKEAFLAAAKPKRMNGFYLVESDRLVVRWGMAIRNDKDEVWAYEADAPTKGGYVCGSGKYLLLDQPLTAEQVTALIGK